MFLGSTSAMLLCARPVIEMSFRGDSEGRHYGDPAASLPGPVCCLRVADTGATDSWPDITRRARHTHVPHATKPAPLLCQQCGTDSSFKTNRPTRRVRQSESAIANVRWFDREADGSPQCSQ